MKWTIRLELTLDGNPRPHTHIRSTPIKQYFRRCGLACLEVD
jgi:hypothetical protein